MSRYLHLNAFETVAPSANGAWRVPDDDRDYLSLDYWTSTAQTLEEGGFDALFFVDLLGIFETRETGYELASRTPFQFPIGDPFTVVSAAAAVTKRLGFVISASSTYEEPFLLARRFATLDHLTNGRIGWNLVTSYLDSAAANFGLDKQVPHDERYRRADEFVEVVTRLWNESFEPDAVVKDVEAGIYTDPSKVHRIDHDGKYYKVRGPLTLPHSKHGGPVVYQATASEAGIDLAARKSEGVLTRQDSVPQLASLVQRLRDQAREANREGLPKIFTDVQLVIGKTDLEAQERANLLSSLRNEEFQFIWSGIDIRQYPRDTKLKDLQTWGTTRQLRSVAGNYEATIQDFIDYAKKNKSAFTIVGGPETVTNALVDLAEQTGVDGFNIGRGPLTYQLFTELISPRLRERGLIPERSGAPADLRSLLNS